jgi:polyhydroxyalkanoate synthesis repressor PhaR
MAKPIVIKKYANRRLYNTQTSAYVTLETVAGLVRDGVDFTVEDARTGDDITRQILTQIIVESETSGAGLLPVGFLRDLIRHYGSGVGAVLPDYLNMSMKTFTDAQEQWTAALTGSASPSGTASLFQTAMERNMAMMSQAARSFQELVPGMPAGLASGFATGFPGLDQLWPKPAASQPAEADSNEPSELDTLKAQMAAMQEQLSKLAARDG